MNVSPSALEELLHGRSLLIASNRGPIEFERDASGELTHRRGAGGLVTALSHVMRSVPGRWVASAMSSGDREVVRSRQDDHIDVEVDGDVFHLRYLLFDRENFDRYLNRVSNWIFWFLLHGLWDLPSQPRFDHKTREAWEAYKFVNRRFAEVLAEELAGQESTTPVMLHDYHLMLAAKYLRELKPGAFTYHFMHIPWTQPEMMSILPGDMTRETLEGLLSNDLVGFQTERWGRNFMRCCEELLGAKVDWDARVVRYQDQETSVRHYPISIDVGTVRQLAASDEGQTHLTRLQRLLGDRKLIVRVDRLELSKNVVRGLLAYEQFLKSYPEWIGRVVHLALLYPSRQALVEYRAYEAHVLEVHDRINAELGTDDWQPIVLLNEDDYVRALSCLTRYDVLIVNPLVDGMNLASKEGPAVNQNDGVLILSRNAGAWYELSHGAIGVNPYDISEMAEAIQVGLEMDPDERRDRAAALRETVERNDPAKWVYHQLKDIRRLHDS
jgi:trehalose 6-phosphate synthase